MNVNEVRSDMKKLQRRADNLDNRRTLILLNVHYVVYVHYGLVVEAQADGDSLHETRQCLLASHSHSPSAALIQTFHLLQK